MRKTLLAAASLAVLSSTVLSGAALSDTIYPVDRATILQGSPFDFKVELDGVVKPEEVKITINGEDYKKVLGKDVSFVEKEPGVEASAVILRGASIGAPGSYKVEVSAAGTAKAVTWEVFGTADRPKAKNVIFMLGDGLSVGTRTAARIMSKGNTEGKANGRLNMDDLDHMAFIGTSSTDSISVDSANSMSAYMTGHKTAVNALGVYADRTKDSLDDPRVETLGEAVRRTGNRALGVVSTAELQDATPAAVVAHSRRRADKAEIADMLFNVRPDVVLGGGGAYFIPKSTPGSKRKDEKNYVELFKAEGYQIATTKEELDQASKSNSGKIFGVFHPGNMDVTLDREFLKKGTVPKFPNQPGLVQMTKVALDALSKNADGFVLMVEGASIDKMEHPMDWDRAVFEAIEFDQAVGAVREFMKSNPDTLLVVTGDHTHGMSVLGTIDDDKPGTEMREKVGVYDKAGFPNYKDENGDGFPDRVDVSRRLAIFSNNYPDYYETFRPKLDNPFVPAVQNEQKQYVANEAYKDVPGAVLRTGNLPRDNDTAVHAVDDVVLQATGPGSEAFKGYMEESDVYRIVADALALGAPVKKAAAQ